MTERVRALAALFEAAKGVEVFAVADIVQRMWEKLFLGFMLGMAEQAKIPCNTLLLAYTNVKAFEQRRAAERLS
jgi:hypothetical protein